MSATAPNTALEGVLARALQVEATLAVPAFRLTPDDRLRANALVVLLFPAALHRLGQASTFAILAAVSLAQAAFTWRFVPETKQRSLEDIQKFWMTAAT